MAKLPHTAALGFGPEFTNIHGNCSGQFCSRWESHYRFVISVRPKTPIFLETSGRGQSVLEIFVEEQQNLSKFDPEDFHEIRLGIADHERFGINQLNCADTRRSSNLNIALFTRNFNALLVFGRALIIRKIRFFRVRVLEI